MTDTPGTWDSEFSPRDLTAIRAAIPDAIRAGHERSSRAQTEYDDPDGDQDVYGAGMSRAVQKELASLLEGLESYRVEYTSGSRRKMLYVGNALLFPHRVGKRMPRNHCRIRLSYLPEQRRDLLTRASNTKYLEPGLFEMAVENTNEIPSLAEVLETVAASSRAVTLFVPYYSSTADGIGSIYWGPARLNGKYLEFTTPERLTLERGPVRTKSAATPVVPVVPGFASKQREPTPVRMRQRKVDGKDGRQP